MFVCPTVSELRFMDVVVLVFRNVDHGSTVKPKMQQIQALTLLKAGLGRKWIWHKKNCSKIGYIITWILHQIFMFSDKVKLAAG